MSNSKGSYSTTPEQTMAAFDKLPPSARVALREAISDWATQPFLTKWRNGVYKTGKDIAKRIDHLNRKDLAKAEKRYVR